MRISDFEQHRTSVPTRSGEIGCVVVGEGPPALFVHGLMLSSALWRRVVGDLAGHRRCIAVDLLGHGRTAVRSGVEVTLSAQAEMLEDLCDALGLARVDLVANDFGGAVAQLFAVRSTGRLRSLTLTNCDVHDNLGPPSSLAEVVPLARGGKLAPLIALMLDDPTLARRHFPGAGFEDPDLLTPEQVRAFLAPAFSPPDGGRDFEHMLTSIQGDELTQIEQQLRHLTVSTLMVWGTHDTYFDLRGAHWLRETIPGATAVVEVEGGKLFFPFERPRALSAAILPHWAATAHA